MGALDMLGKIGKFVFQPIDTIGEIVNDWAHEPLKKWEHERNEYSKDRDVERKIQLETAVMKAESNIRIAEAEINTNLTIKRETEIFKITTEIEEWKRDQQFNRMVKVTEAIMEYQEKLTKLNISAIAAIGNMELSLRDRAHELILDKTMKYRELQDAAIKQAEIDLLSIEEKFSHNERAQTILTNAIDLRLSNIMHVASNFISELNSDIKMLNENIDTLTKNGQKFIEAHLQQFHALNPAEVVRQIEEK